MFRVHLLIGTALLLQAGPVAVTEVPLHNSVFRIGKTIAIVSHAMSLVTGCKIYDIDKHADTAQSDILSLGQQVLDVQLHEMLNLINRCRLLDIEKLNSSAAAEGDNRMDEFNSREMRESLGGNFTDMLSLWRGIVPGTKWCGPGDEADNYADIGSKFIVDTCCRAHDLCPIRLRPFRMGYGMVNFSVYTKSHCSCDDEFQRCLKETQTPLGDVIGNLYFNVLKFGCLEEHVDEVPENGFISRSFRSSSSSFRTPGKPESRLRVSYKRNATY